MFVQCCSDSSVDLVLNASRRVEESGGFEKAKEQNRKMSALDQMWWYDVAGGE